MNAALFAYLTATVTLAQITDYAPFMQWGLGGFLVWFLVQVVVKKLDSLAESQREMAHRLAGIGLLMALDLQERDTATERTRCRAKEEGDKIQAFLARKEKG